MSNTPSSEAEQGEAARSLYRHSLTVRVTHWLNLLFMVIMLGSGLQIFNAHPALYWGSRSDPDTAWLSVAARASPTGLQGVTQLFTWNFETTGFLGVSSGPSGRSEARAFPSWATIPGPRWLAMGRRWHLFFAWLFVLNALVYVVHSAASRHLSRDLVPRGQELRGIHRSIRHHLSARRLRAEAARGYNILQKLSYLIVIFGLGPLIVLTGLAMSPWLNSEFPGLLSLFDGRQSARTLHFVAAFAFVVFVLVHVTMVVLVGPINHMRAMITGRLVVKESKS